MKLDNRLDFHSREELYQWYLENHDKVSDFWLRENAGLSFREHYYCMGISSFTVMFLPML